MPRRALFLTLLFLLLPTAVAAEQGTTWDFRGSKLPGKWDVTGFDSVQAEENGLHIRSSQQGQIMKQNDLSHPVEAMVLTFLSPRDSEALLLWHKPGMPADSLIQLPFTIPAGNDPVQLSLSDYPDWNANFDRIGIMLPAGTDVTLQQMDFLHWGMLERLHEAWRSFWTFDHTEPYSINFLWGPVLASNPLQTSQLYSQLPPPHGWSLNRVLLPLLLLIALGLFLWWFLDRPSRNRRILGMSLHLGWFLLACATCWILFDLRMGTEFLLNARTDYETYISQDLGKRLFRTLGDFPDTVEQSLPELQAHPFFGFVSVPGAPVKGLARYWAYPSVPAETPEQQAQAEFWLIYSRPDVGVDDSGHLIVEGKAVAGPGQIVQRFSSDSFLFRQNLDTDPTPAP